MMNRRAFLTTIAAAAVAPALPASSYLNKYDVEQSEKIRRFIDWQLARMRFFYSDEFLALIPSVWPPMDKLAVQRGWKRDHELQGYWIPPLHMSLLFGVVNAPPQPRGRLWYARTDRPMNIVGLGA